MSDYSSYLDIPYKGATHPRQSLNLFIPKSASPTSQLLVWIHGGAWMSESKEDFTTTLVPRIVKLTNLPLAVLEYRLTPEIAHPEHIVDVISGLSLLTSSTLLDCEGGSPKWNRNDLALAGHSVGAFLCCQLTLQPPPPLRSFTVPSSIRQAITSIVIIAGIYDLNDMLEEYPSYASWTKEAMGSDMEVIALESVSNWKLYDDEQGVKLRFFVVSGKEDELVSERQANLMVKRLKELLGSDKEIEERLRIDYDTVKGTHDSMLHKDEIPQLWADFIKK